MREIKFRAYQQHTSLDRQPGIYEITDIVWYEKTHDGYTGEVFFNKHSASSEYLEDVELMQFTGLKDRRDKDVYEGDILKITNPFTNKSVLKKVWRNGRHLKLSSITYVLSVTMLNY